MLLTAKLNPAITAANPVKVEAKQEPFVITIDASKVVKVVDAMITATGLLLGLIDARKFDGL